MTRLAIKDIKPSSALEEIGKKSVEQLYSLRPLKKRPKKKKRKKKQPRG